MMRPVFTLFILISVVENSLAQKKIWRKHRISQNLVENFEVEANRKTVKDGEYFVINDKKYEVVRGRFNQGVKDSIWNFFGIDGSLVQKYDYSEKKLLYYPSDINTIVKDSFYIMKDGAIASGAITRPIKIGGNEYGFYLLYNSKSLPPQVKQQQGDVNMEYIFTISENGTLLEWHIKYSSTFYNDDMKMSINNLPQDAYEFIPASVDGKNIKSKLIYLIPINVNQARDRGTYNIPTQENR